MIILRGIDSFDSNFKYAGYKIYYSSNTLFCDIGSN